MNKIKVWTKQHRDAWEVLERTGRHTASRSYIAQDLQEHAELVLEVYDWLVANSPNASSRPADVEYPVWVSFRSDATMLPSPGTVTLELELDPALIAPVNIEKWGTILNYSYIPKDESDAKRHRRLLDAYGVSDAKAYMSQFYPLIKREIVDNWPRLFDDAILLGSDLNYGILWEVKKEWVTQIAR